MGWADLARKMGIYPWRTMSRDPISEALADVIRQGSQQGPVRAEGPATKRVVVDMSDDQTPIHLFIDMADGSQVSMRMNDAGAESLIDQLRLALRMVNAARTPDTPDLKRVK